MLRVRKGLLLSFAIMFAGVSFMAVAEHGMPSASQPADKNQAWQASRARPQISLTTAFDAHGKLWLARVENGQILLSHSDNQGQAFSAAVTVNAEKETIAAEGENRPKIAFGTHNDIYLSWTRSLDQPYSGDIRFARSLDGGKHFSPPISVNDNNEIISHRFDAMGVDKQGSIHLVWLDKRDQALAKRKGEDYSGSALYYAISKDADKTFSVNQKLVDHSCECCRIAMDFENDGTPVIFWRHIYGRNVRDHALLRLDEKSQPVRVSYDHWEIAACPHHGGAISIDPDNNYHLTWFNNGPESHGLFYAHSTDRGQTFSPPLAVGNYANQAAHPFVLAVKQSIYLVWKEFDGQQSSIRLMHSADNGNSWSAARTLAATDGASDHPLLVSDGARAWLSWNTAKQGLVFRVVAAGEKS